jgi:hypothetical protein
MMEEALSQDTLLARKARVPQHVVYRTFVSETVMLNLTTGRYHGLNPTAGRMLELLEKAPTIGAAAALLAEEYAQPLDQIERDLGEFCSELRERGLLEVEADDDAAAAS